MKKRIAFILALMLPLCAGSETIRNQINAPETYQATYYSNTKRTKISVDAKVTVPDVSVIPTYAVGVRDFTAEDAWRLANLTDPDKGWYRSDDPDGELRLDELKYKRFGVKNQYEGTGIELMLPETYSAYISLDNDYYIGVFGRQPVARRIHYRWHDPETYLFFYDSIYFMHQETVGKTLKGQPLTVEEATKMANAFMAQMAPEYELRIVAGTEGEKGDGKVYKYLAYCFGYTRTVGGVPITYAEYSRSRTGEDDVPMAPEPGHEMITLTIHEDKVVNFCWYDPYEIGDVMQPSTDLLPFDRIMDIFGTLAPLSVQVTENDIGSESKPNNGLHITDIQLGYMPVLKKNDPNQWELRPVWDFFGWKILPLETYDWPCFSQLTIDAIDGTVIDRNYGY